jgi:hypothetical protein
MYYKIWNRYSGFFLGVYEGETEQDAELEMVKEAGYQSIEEARQVCGAYDDELIIEKV